MRSMVVRALGFVASLAVFMMVAATPALAGHNDKVKHPRPSHAAPEIDPAGLGAMASLLIGGAMLLKSRRTRPTA